MGWLDFKVLPSVLGMHSSMTIASFSGGKGWRLLPISHFARATLHVKCSQCSYGYSHFTNAEMES